MTNKNIKAALHVLKSQLKHLESFELYENCVIIKREIDLIESNNEVEYMKFKFDVNELEKCGFLNKTNDNSKHVEKICTFFGFNSIFEYSKEITGVHLST